MAADIIPSLGGLVGAGTESVEDYDYEWVDDNPNQWYIRVLETLLYSTLAFSIFWSSSCVILVVARTPQLHYPPGYLMVCMSVCDVFMSVIIASGIPTAIDHSILYPSGVTHFLGMLLAFFQNINALCLMVSALDQFVSIYWPLKYHQLVTTKRLIITFVVIGSFGCILPMYWAMTQASFQDNYVYICYLTVEDPSSILPELSLCVFVGPGVVVLLCYSLILASVIKEKRSQIREQSGDRRGSAALQGIQMIAQLNACKMLFLVTIIFFSSFLPYMAADQYIVMTGQYLPPWLMKISSWMMFLQSMFNSLIFYKMNVSFKKGVDEILRHLPIFSSILKEDCSDAPGQDTKQGLTGTRASFMSNSPRPSSSNLQAGSPTIQEPASPVELTTMYGNSLSVNVNV